MNSFNADDSELDDAINKAKSPQSSSTGDASDSPPFSVSQLLSPEELAEAKSKYLIIGRKPHLVPLVPEVEAGADYIDVEARKGDLRIRCGHWTPPCPPLNHPETRENDRRYELWRRHRRWVGSSGPELTVKFLRSDLEDCSVGDDNDGGSWSPLLPNDPDTLAPLGLDLLPESRRGEFASLAAARGVNIDLFFRADDDLGLWNDPARAAKELNEALDRRKEITPASPLPTIAHVPSPSELAKKMEGGGGGDSSGQNIGGRGFPH